MAVLFWLLLYFGGTYWLVYLINEKSPAAGQVILRLKPLLVMACLFMSWYSMANPTNGKSRTPFTFLILALAVWQLPRPKKSAIALSWPQVWGRALGFLFAVSLCVWALVAYDDYKSERLKAELAALTVDAQQAPPADAEAREAPGGMDVLGPPTQVPAEPLMAVVEPEQVVDSGGPSFDCSRAGTGIERMICGSSGLSQLDRRLHGAYMEYREVSGDPDEARRQQVNWIRERRDLCQDVDCLTYEYHSRIDYLSSMASLMGPSDRRTTP